MKDINKLIKKAKSIAIGQPLGMHMAFIELSSDRLRFISKCHLWDGIQGGEYSVITNDHDSKEAAEKYIESIGEMYPSKKTSIVFFDIPKREDDLCDG